MNRNFQRQVMDTPSQALGWANGRSKMGTDRAHWIGLYIFLALMRFNRYPVNLLPIRI